VLNAGKGRAKHVIGFKLAFSAALDPARAGNAANFTVTQTMKHGREKAVVPVHLKVVYDSADDTVSLLFAGHPRFTLGGQIEVSAAPPSGLMGTSGAYLAGNGGQGGSEGVFTILRNAKSVVTG
jgi:hypothetical protein